MADKIITYPTFEPITVADVAEYLRVDNVALDTPLLEALITTARQYLEQYLNRYIAEQTVETALTGWSTEMTLSSPVQSVTSIKYLDVNGAEQTLNSNQYVVDTYSEPAKITPAYNVSYPELYAVENNVKVRFVTGFTTGSSPDDHPMPQPLKFAMMLIIGDLYANREGQSDKSYQVNPTVQNLLSFYRLEMGM
jgi:uncharacterized phiE125 gp8 family phage protein